MISSGQSSVTLDDIMSRVTEADILAYYFNISEIPCIIHSPLRKDKRPSFGLYSSDGKRIYYTDLATKERGGIFDLLSQYWGISYKEVLARIYKDLGNFTSTATINKYSPISVRTLHSYNSNSELQVKVREWKEHDIEYWKSYGIELKWLKYADVYPISHKIIVKDNRKYIFAADKYAYAYIERKEGNITIKVYQPFNKNGYKWTSKHDSSVISLWTKIPEYGDKVCICASLKDALCLMSNLNIPSLAIQGEGFNVSNTAINELKRRYKEVYILLDNDEVGLKDGLELSESTGFINLVLPQFEGGKDISDAYKVLGRERWVELIKPLFCSSR